MLGNDLFAWRSYTISLQAITITTEGKVTNYTTEGKVQKIKLYCK